MQIHVNFVILPLALLVIFFLDISLSITGFNSFKSLTFYLIAHKIIVKTRIKVEYSKFGKYSYLAILKKKQSFKKFS